MDTTGGAGGPAGSTAAKPAAPTPPPQPSTHAEQTCVGIGWVTLDQSRGPRAPVDVNEIPTLRCFGARANRVLAASAYGASPGAIPAKQPTASAGEGATGLDVDMFEETWALACAGQFSLLAPAFAASAAHGAGHGAGAASMTTAATPTWAMPRARCSGISIRLDVQRAERKGAEQADQSIRTDDRHTRTEDQEAVLPSPKEFAEAWIRGVGNVLGRVGLIALKAQFASLDPGPTVLATNTATAAGRICRQAGKIARRSVEYVGWAATKPFDAWDPADDAGPSTRPRPGGD